MRYGYARPFAEKDKNDLQYKALAQIDQINLYEETHASAKKRVQLEKLLKTVTTGEELYVYNFYVLADSTRHLLEILQFLSSKNVSVHFLDNNINSLSSSTYTLMEILEELTEFQSEAISNKTKIGLLEAQKKGTNVGRPKKSMSSVNLAIEMYHTKTYTIEEITEKTGISKSTLYRNLEN